MINELPEINVPQSIRQGKLVYHLKGWSWFSYLESRIGIMICLGLLIAWVIFYYDVAFADIVSILLIGLMIANLLTINKLVKVDRRLYAISEDKIVSVLENFDPDMQIVSKTSHMIKATTPGFFTWGNVWTVLITDDSIYINLSSIGKGGDLISPLPALHNYTLSRRLATLLIT